MDSDGTRCPVAIRRNDRIDWLCCMGLPLTVAGDAYPGALTCPGGWLILTTRFQPVKRRHSGEAKRDSWEGGQQVPVRLISFRNGEESSFGAVVEGRVVDLGRHLPEYDSLKALLNGQGLVRALDTAAEVSPDYRLNKLTVLPPLPDAERMLCVFDDARDDAVVVDPKFVRGSGARLRIPPGDSRPLAAGMAVVVEQNEGGHSPIGYSLLTYLSPAAIAMGPWLVTPDEFGEADGMTIIAAVGEERAELHLPDPAAAVSALAARENLGTGAIIGLLHFLPELSAGVEDEVSVSAEPIGELSNVVATLEG